MFNPLDWMYHRNFQVREGQLGNGASSNEEGKLESNAPRGCTVKMIQRTHNEGQSPGGDVLSMWCCGNQAAIQISEGVIIYYRKKTGSLCNNSYSF